MIHETEHNTSPNKSAVNFFSLENLSVLGGLIICVFAIKWSLISPYVVPTASMEPTIKGGDRLLALKYAYKLKLPFTNIELLEISPVKRGDIIVFHYPKDLSINYVKRIIGLPGDRIKILEDTLYINGAEQKIQRSKKQKDILFDILDQSNVKILSQENLFEKKHWVLHDLPSTRSIDQKNWPDDLNEFVVAKNSVFVMGDNRHNSVDSRDFGVVPIDHIIGKASFILWSFKNKNHNLFPDEVRFNRFFTRLDTLP